MSKKTKFEDVTISGLEYRMLKDKAESWDKLESDIAKYYVDENGDELSDDEGGNLLDIGETAAMAFGFL